MNLPPYLLTPLPTLLGLHPGAMGRLVNPPDGFVDRLKPLPDGVEFLATAKTGFDVTFFFTRSKVELLEKLPALSQSMAVTGAIWVFAPLIGDEPHLPSEDFIRRAALDLGLVDNKRCALDEVWSGLRLVWKPRLRADKPERRAEA